MPLSRLGDTGTALGIVDSLVPLFQTPSACPSRGQACGWDGDSHETANPHSSQGGRGDSSPQIDPRGA